MKTASWPIERSRDKVEVNYCMGSREGKEGKKSRLYLINDFTLLLFSEHNC
jgi:hypothetical protein